MRRFLAAFLILPMLVACDDDPAGPDADTSHVGTYQLQTVDGEDVPVSFDEDGGVLTILEGSLALNADGTFSFEAELEFTEGGETTSETTELSGTYTKVADSNTVTFDHDGEDQGFEEAAINGDVLTTMGGGDEVLVFEK